jgi:hypothetical protein
MIGVNIMIRAALIDVLISTHNNTNNPNRGEIIFILFER